MNDFSSLYNAIDTDIIRYRFNSYSSTESYLNDLINRFRNHNVKRVQLGNSVLGNQISGILLGDHGPTILIWSQMHGNESTMTRALFLYLESLLSVTKDLKVQLYIIPILNPDGNNKWIRNNANDVDLNRDALQLSQPESQILRNAYEAFQPDFCFNLHDQRSIYGTDKGDKPIPISFLAPAGDIDKTVDIVRIKAMYLINQMLDAIKGTSAIIVGRYDDTFNKNCVGDYFSSNGTPTVLFEAGQWNENYNRDEIVIHMAHALSVAIDSIGEMPKDNIADEVVTRYKAIPEIANSYCDILIKNFPAHNERVKLGIMYKEIVEDHVLHYIPTLTSINDPSIKNGHRVIDCLKYQAEDMDVDIIENQIFISELLNVDILY